MDGLSTTIAFITAKRDSLSPSLTVCQHLASSFDFVLTLINKETQEHFCRSLSKSLAYRLENITEEEMKNLDKDLN